MELIKNLSLSVYAFGYCCGFVNDQRSNAKEYQSLTPQDVAKISHSYGLGGVEVPVDRYFANIDDGSLEEYIEFLSSMNLRLIFALENLNSDYFSKLAPLVKKTGSTFIRVKVGDFYGGNRFCQRDYKEMKEKFISDVQKCVPAIDKYRVKIMVENHQDITINDLEIFIKKFGDNRIGVNWDIGNSFPTGETTSSFLKKVGQYIGNIHLKDYRLSKTDNGYMMHRCILGDGVVDFENIIPYMMKMTNGDIPMTIELGALIGREAMVNNPEYWLHTEGVKESDKDTLIDFVNSHLESESDIISEWEKKSDPKLIADKEIDEVQISVEHIKSIINRLQSSK